ncbi:MAG: wax ester/triacylglycerol synthase family O-acyltransferase [Actinomycetota bacterium]|nr:wax ester/triacylglycerol synthase family O-acyltransferase [Actinomycetota bacterium]
MTGAQSEVSAHGHERLSPLDAAFLSLEAPHAPMHVGWAAKFAPRADGSRPTFEDIRAHIAGRLGRAPRYRQRLAEVPLGLGDPVWVDDPQFDISDHVLRAGHGDFQRLADEVLSTPLKHGRPLWELWIAEQLDDGRLGVVGKAHHCLVDGLAAIELMALLLDAEPEPEAGDEPPWAPQPGAGPLGLAADAIRHQAQQTLELATLPLSYAFSPSRVLELPAGLWRTSRALANTAAPLAPRSRLNGPMTARRHLACERRSLQDIKTIKQRFGTTINDVLLAATAGALRSLAREHGEPARPVKAQVPVSVAALDERWGNRLAFLFVELPTKEADPVWRLRDIHVAMRDRKQAKEPETVDAVFNAVSRAPRQVRRLASKLIASPLLSNLTVSNIPGPQLPLFLMGCEALQAYPVVPLTDGHGISVGMTTIQDEACLGVYAQAELAADADLLARSIGEELDALLARSEAAAGPVLDSEPSDAA